MSDVVKEARAILSSVAVMAKNERLPSERRLRTQSPLCSATTQPITATRPNRSSG